MHGIKVESSVNLMECFRWLVNSVAQTILSAPPRLIPRRSRRCLDRAPAGPFEGIHCAASKSHGHGVRYEPEYIRIADPVESNPVKAGHAGIIRGRVQSRTSASTRLSRRQTRVSAPLRVTCKTDPQREGAHGIAT